MTKPKPSKTPTKSASKTRKTPKAKPAASRMAKPAKAGKSPRRSADKKMARKARRDVPAVSRPRDSDERRESLAMAKIAIEAAVEKKGVDPILIDVSGRSSYADFIAVVSGRSDRQVDAIADSVCDAMAARGRRPIGREGARNGRWVLIDFGDLVLHVFYHPLREVFDIESLWIDAPRVKLQLPAETGAE